MLLLLSGFCSFTNSCCLYPKSHQLLKGITTEKVWAHIHSLRKNFVVCRLYIWRFWKLQNFKGCLLRRFGAYYQDRFHCEHWCSSFFYFKTLHTYICILFACLFILVTIIVAFITFEEYIVPASLREHNSFPWCCLHRLHMLVLR